jgi:acetyl esterase/lipase
MGWVCASIEYRLSGEAIWPAQIEDCKCAIRFLRSHSEQYGLDPHRIGVWGSSAGGHLVAMLGTTGRVSELEGTGGWPGVSSAVQAVCDWYGPTDFLRMDAAGSEMVHDAPDSPESELVGGAIQLHPERVARANPISYVAGDEPPFLIVHGTRDPLVPYNQSELLFSALAGRTDVTFITVEGAGHGGLAFETAEVMAHTQSFLVSRLGPAR